MTARPGLPSGTGRARRPTLAVAAALGLLVDRGLGEPPARLHPVVWFGRAMTALEHRLYADRRARGLAYVAGGVALGVTGGQLLQRVLGRRVATVAATALAVGGRMLDQEAIGIADRLERGDLAGARVALRSLVGRRTDELTETEVVRAVIESVAENTVDAVTAALCFAAVGGAPMVAAYRAINTMDAMVGHRNVRYRRFGWAAARLDDVANLIPARLTAALLLAPLLLRPPPAPTATVTTDSGARGDPRADPVVDPRRVEPGHLRHPEPARHPRGTAGPVGGRARWAVVRSQAAAHPSPNGGLVEAAFAHRLGVVLGGVNHYGNATQDRGRLGHGGPPTRADIHRAVALRRQVSAVTAVVLVLLSALSTRLGRRWTGRKDLIAGPRRITPGAGIRPW